MRTLRIISFILIGLLFLAVPLKAQHNLTIEGGFGKSLMLSNDLKTFVKSFNNYNRSILTNELEDFRSATVFEFGGGYRRMEKFHFGVVSKFMYSRSKENTAQFIDSTQFKIRSKMRDISVHLELGIGGDAGFFAFLVGPFFRQAQMQARYNYTDDISSYGFDQPLSGIYNAQVSGIDVGISFAFRVVRQLFFRTEVAYPIFIDYTRTYDRKFVDPLQEETEERFTFPKNYTIYQESPETTNTENVVKPEFTTIRFLFAITLII